MKGHAFIALFVIAFVSCGRTELKTANDVREDGAPTPELSRVYFPFASDIILPDEAAVVDKNVEWLNEHPDTYFILEGHCDEVGPREYNMELGDRRARAVKAHMLQRGIPGERIIMVVSYGSDHPLNLGHRIEDLRENRRVEFVIR